MKILIFLAAGTLLMAILFLLAIPFLLQFNPDLHAMESVSNELHGSTGGEIFVMGAIMGDFGMALGFGLVHALALFAALAGLAAALLLTIMGQLFQIGKEARWKQLTGKNLSVVVSVLHVVSVLSIFFLLMLDLAIGRMGLQSAIIAGLFTLLAGLVCVLEMWSVKKFKVMPKQEEQKELL